MKKLGWGIVFVALSAASAEAQGHHYMTLGRNPCIRGGLSEQQAQARGWQPFRFQQDEYLTMQGASGEWVSGWLPVGTRAAVEPGGRVRLLDCGNPTSLRIRIQTRVKIVQRERIVQVQAPPQVVYVYGPTVYPTAPMPQPQVTFINRVPVYANIFLPYDNGNKGATTNNFVTANGGRTVSGSESISGALSGSSADLFNINTTDINNASGATATNGNVNTTGVSTGPGTVNAGGVVNP